VQRMPDDGVLRTWWKISHQRQAGEPAILYLLLDTYRRAA
jgi:hypothetical protein